MLNSLRAVARFFQKTIGWNRIGVLLSIAIISIAAVVLFHMLRDIDTNEVVSALKATQPTHIAAAANRTKIFFIYGLIFSSDTNSIYLNIQMTY